MFPKLSEMFPKLTLLRVDDDNLTTGMDVHRFIFVAGAPFNTEEQSIEKIKKGEYDVMEPELYSYHHKLMHASSEDFNFIDEDGFDPIIICTV